MMKYLQCEQVLAYRNDHFEVEKRAYQRCLVSYEHLKKICQEPNPSTKMQSNKEASLISEPENKVKSDPGLDM
ncbi:hypothetical protein [Acinetobacter boissieri]|uniref:Uncharacterized protein n=1 Tax=Acinetobacter boissieri TaxID=1219383 RepID=A0A1G6JPY9_9GAMM|nr:hypothetical protein [Acinetobacter boissieri]SDC20822.1 hypothetical protein SAMN05421733_11222 [Acinetobacter boissieri]